MLRKHTIERMLPGQLMQHYLLASYCYYHLSQSPLTDDAFDRLCVRLAAAYPTLDHQHKHLVSMEDLDAGTCLLQAEQFPRLVQIGGEHYAHKCISGALEREIEPYLLPTVSRAPRIARRLPPQVEVAPPPARRVVRRTPPPPVILEDKPPPVRRIVRVARTK